MSVVAMTAARRQAYQTHRARSHQRRHAADPLTPEQIDRIVLQAAIDGCEYEQIQARLAAARQAAVQLATFTYPSTGTVHAVDGDTTMCGQVWVAGFREQHPDWLSLFNRAASREAVTCRACRRAFELSERAV